MAHSTFASAISGSSGSAQSHRTNDWSRRNVQNGSQIAHPGTLKFTSSNYGPQKDDSRSTTKPASAQPAGVYAPPTFPSQDGSVYTRDDMIALFEKQLQEGSLKDNLADLFMKGWDPAAFGENSNSSWHSQSQLMDGAQKPAVTADVCWDSSGSNLPLGLVDLSDIEKEIFNTSVNSSIKMSQQNGKDGLVKDPLSHRKSSILGQHHGLGSPGSARAPNRRRDTGDLRQTYSPSGGPPHRMNREEVNPPQPPAGLLRRRTEAGSISTFADVKDGDAPDSTDAGKLFQSLKRTASALPNSQTPQWSSTSSSAFTPMGQFGSGAGDASPSPAGKTRPGFGSFRGQSRFKGLMSDGDANDNETKSFPRNDEDKGLAWGALRGNRAAANFTNPFESSEVMYKLGSSALVEGTSIEEKVPRGILGEGVSDNTPSSQSGPDLNEGDAESSTDTNPYDNSVPDNRNGNQDGQMEAPDRNPLPRVASDRTNLSRIGSFAGIASPFDIPGTDRPRPAGHGLPGLGGIGGSLAPGSSVWATSSGVATPSNERQPSYGPSNFNDGVFAPLGGDFNSPMLAGLGSSNGSFLPNTGSFMSGTATPGGTHTGSRLGSLFSMPFQDPLRGRGTPGPQRATLSRPDDSVDIGSPVVNLNGRTGFGLPDPLRSLHGLEDPAGPDARQNDGQVPMSGGMSTASPAPNSHMAGGNANYQRTMVMPDQMLWIYKDPQGKIQGPWTGLEMHDWYKARFFNQELLVKRVEDPDFEPLANFIRRIGNNREPFLVPQPGIPHPPQINSAAWSTLQQVHSTPATVPGLLTGLNTIGGALTAEQQNALERRKQEEQYLSARLKEFHAQHQLPKQAFFSQGRMLPQQLHSSAHPSQFGMIGHGQSDFPTPLGHLGSQMGSFFNSSSFGTLAGQSNELPTDMLSSLNLHEGSSIGFHDGQGPSLASQAVEEQRELLKAEQLNHDANVVEAQAAAESLNRLQQFQELRDDTKTGEVEEEASFDGEQVDSYFHNDANVEQSEYFEEAAPENAAFDEQSSTVASEPPQNQSPWAKVDVGPVHSIQAALESEAEERREAALSEESVDEIKTPLVEELPSPDTPSGPVAPWARDNIETTRGPSLKEIQEAEARKAAEQEEIAAVARRAAIEKEAAIARAQAQEANVAAAPGLPATSNWASGAGAKSSSSAPWSKTLAGRAEPSSSAKKSLQQIQQEEEARKQRISANQAAANASKTSLAAPVTKRYADYASQASAAPQSNNASSGAWTTVGSSGKPKRSPIPAQATVARPPVVPAASIVTLQKPKQVVRVTSTNNIISPENALEEVRKWSIGELKPDLNKNINVDDFVTGLISFPCEMDIITEAVHAVSMTIDSRRFAEQFIRRRTLADKGIIEAGTPSTAKGQSDGWNEVARRSQAAAAAAREEPSNGSFRLVAAKKRGKR